MENQSQNAWMRLDKFDLNLLVALHVLLEERSVTRAAARLNITQPAMSAALRRLRDAFNDQLLVSSGKKMVPTPHAYALAQRVAEMIRTSQELIATSTKFDPGTSQRAFRIAASDYIAAIVLRSLLVDIAITAPMVRINIVPPHTHVLADLENGKVDCIISPEQYAVRGHPRVSLFEERHVLIGCRDNPIFRGGVSMEDYTRAGHVVVEVSDTATFAEEYVRGLGHVRRVQLVVPSFSSVPLFLPATDRIALVHERLAKLFLGILPLASSPPPFEVPLMTEILQFHATRQEDGGLAWLVAKVVEHSQRADGPSPLN